MRRYIEVNKLKADIKEIAGIQDGKLTEFEVLGIMSGQPTADVRENVRGEWLSKNLDNFRKYEVICSVCGARFIGNYDAYDEPYDFNFCPNCGADMRGEDNGRDEENHNRV